MWMWWVKVQEDLWKYNLELLKKRVMGCVTDQVKSYGLCQELKVGLMSYLMAIWKKKKGDFYGVQVLYEQYHEREKKKRD